MLNFQRREAGRMKTLSTQAWANEPWWHLLNHRMASRYQVMSQKLNVSQRRVPRQTDRVVVDYWKRTPTMLVAAVSLHKWDAGDIDWLAGKRLALPIHVAKQVLNVGVAWDINWLIAACNTHASIRMIAISLTAAVQHACCVFCYAAHFVTWFRT